MSRFYLKKASVFYARDILITLIESVRACRAYLIVGWMAHFKGYRLCGYVK